jgi:hypothetical protein
MIPASHVVNAGLVYWRMEVFAREWDEGIGWTWRPVYDRTYDDRKTPIVEGKDHEFEFHERLPRPGEPPLVSGRYDVRISWIHGGVHMPDGSDFPLTGTTGTVEVR